MSFFQIDCACGDPKCDYGITIVTARSGVGAVTLDVYGQNAASVNVTLHEEERLRLVAALYGVPQDTPNFREVLAERLVAALEGA